jgi:hypothetical protein
VKTDINFIFAPKATATANAVVGALFPKELVKCGVTPEDKCDDAETEANIVVQPSRNLKIVLSITMVVLGACLLVNSLKSDQ